jgi:hypothetical protein
MNTQAAQPANYALAKVKAIRAENAKNYELGHFAVAEQHTEREIDRLQTMNLSLVNARHPEKDLVKDIPGYKVPAVSDPAMKSIIAGKDR